MNQQTSWTNWSPLYRVSISVLAPIWCKSFLLYSILNRMITSKGPYRSWGSHFYLGYVDNVHSNLSLGAISLHFEIVVTWITDPYMLLKLQKEDLLVWVIHYIIINITSALIAIYFVPSHLHCMYESTRKKVQRKAPQTSLVLWGFSLVSPIVFQRWILHS